MTQNRKVTEKTPSTNNQVRPDPMLNRIYQNRGVKLPEDLDYGLAKILSPWTMKDIDKAVDKIIEHIHKGSNILIVGDYDCDGATSTTIAVDGLYMCGAKQVDFVVPDRAEHGYGLSESLVDDIDNLKIVDRRANLMITVDNGIVNFDGAERVAKMKEPCELVITDHHLASEDGAIPLSAACVNPNRIDCKFPSKNIAGCGVMFYVIMALRSKMEQQGDFEKLGIVKPDLRLLLDVLTLGTIADVVTLDYNNRVIVTAGLKRMNNGIMRPGMQAILDVAGRKTGELVASDMGFAVGPRINAAGRISDMSVGIRCLLAKTYDEAILIARELDFLNKQRKEIEQEMTAEANVNPDYDPTKYGITILGNGWHEGVVGIVSSRIKEKANRPVICFTQSEPHKGRAVAKGSARSVKGVHLKHLLKEIEAIRSDIFIKFGGHAMAAGLSIYEEFYEDFSILFNEGVKRHITQDILDGLLEVDFKNMPEEFLSLQKAYALEANGPWGQNFEEPVFAGEFDIVSTKPLSENKHLKVELQKGRTRVEGIWFNCIDDSYLSNPFTGRVNVIFTMSINRFMGKETLQLMIRHMEQVVVESGEAQPVNIKSLTGRKRNMEDSCLSIGAGDIINKVLNNQ